MRIQTTWLYNILDAYIINVVEIKEIIDSSKCLMSLIHMCR